MNDMAYGTTPGAPDPASVMNSGDDARFRPTGEPFKDPGESRRKLANFATMKNIAEAMDPNELALISQRVLFEFAIDRRSMSDWLDKMRKAVENATLVKSARSYPFPRSANVKYPLVTSAAIQFAARALPIIIPPEGPVKVRTNGADPKSEKAKRAMRVGEYMNHTCLVTMTEWEEDMDRLLVQLPIVGTMFKKVWYDPTLGRAKSRVLKPGALIVNNQITNLQDAPRVSEQLTLNVDEIARRQRDGRWSKLSLSQHDTQGSQDIVDDTARTDRSDDTLAPKNFIEQHRMMDLDGDGVLEPYVVTVHIDTKQVMRIAAGYRMKDVIFGPDGEVLDIAKSAFFIDYHFMPSMDGTFMGTGLGILLGDISATINSTINMLMDAGHMASLGGGFIGSGMRLKGGPNNHRPGEWKMLQTDGATVRDSMVPMTFPGPDPTLFSLLGMLIDAGKEVAAVKDVLTGDVKTNMTATATMALIEQGLTVFTSIHQRIHRSIGREFRLMAKIYAATVNPVAYNKFHDVQPGQEQIGANGGPVMEEQAPLDPAADFDQSDRDITPFSDPRHVTKMQRLGIAQIYMEMAQQGLIDKKAAAKYMLEAMSSDNVEELVPPVSEEEQAQIQRQNEAQVKLAEGEAAMKTASAAKDTASAKKTDAETADIAKKPLISPERRRAELEALAARLRIEQENLTENRKMEVDISLGLAKLIATGSEDSAQAQDLETLLSGIRNDVQQGQANIEAGLAEFQAEIMREPQTAPPPPPTQPDQPT